MKPLLANARLIFVILVGGLAALMLVWAGNAANRMDSAVLAAPLARGLASQYIPGLECTLAVTNLQDFTGQSISTTLNDAVMFSALASYSGLVLSYGDVPTSPVSFPVFDEYFRLDNAVIGAVYKVEAIPDYTTNYNLGIILYDATYTPVLTDVNPADNNNARVTLLSNSIGPYYIRVAQLTSYCTGLTYHLKVTFLVPTPANLPDVYDNPPGANDTITTAAILSQNYVTGLTLCNLAYCDPGVPSDDQDWYAIYALAGFHDAVSAASDGVYPVLNMQIYGPDKTTLIGQALDSNNPFFVWMASSTGSHYVHIWRASGSLTNGTYHLNWSAMGNLVYLPIIFKQ
jgi:hypothetical protein